MNTYKTIRKSSSDEFIVKKSRFIGYIAPVTTQEDALNFINEIKSKHWNATHNVYAYVLREGQTRRYSDDGEPKGTAGIPTLDVLLKEGLTDCAVVVTRYFGGIMLGAGGLVRAYTQGAKIAVDAGGILTMSLCKLLMVRCDYNYYGRLISLIPEMGGIVEDTEFTDEVRVDLRIPENLADAFGKAVIDTSLGKFKSEYIGERFDEI